MLIRQKVISLRQNKTIVQFLPLIAACALLAALFFLRHLYPAKLIQISEIKHEEVILYSTSWCSYCARTSAFLTKNNIKFIEYDIEKSAQGRIQHQALNAKGVPVMDIKGTIIYGYDLKNTQHVLQVLKLM